LIVKLLNGGVVRRKRSLGGQMWFFFLLFVSTCRSDDSFTQVLSALLVSVSIETWAVHRPKFILLPVSLRRRALLDLLLALNLQERGRLDLFIFFCHKLLNHLFFASHFRSTHVLVILLTRVLLTLIFKSEVITNFSVAAILMNLGAAAILMSLGVASILLNLGIGMLRL